MYDGGCFLPGFETLDLKLSIICCDQPPPQRCPTPIRWIKTLSIHRLVLISHWNCRVICAKSTKLFKTCFQKQFLFYEGDKQWKKWRPEQTDLYLCSLPATSSSSAAFPVFLAPPSPWLPALSSASPPTPFASGSPEELAVRTERKILSPTKQNQKPQQITR